MGKGRKAVLVGAGIALALALAAWSAAYAQVSPPFWTNDCRTPWNAVVQGGSSVTAYATCTSSETRTCNGGALSGSYINELAAASCSGGACVGGYCWHYTGNLGSCNTVCATYGKTCNLTGTKDYAGSGGSNANCTAVFNALGVGSGSAASQSYIAGHGYGCNNDYDEIGRARMTSPATTCEANTTDYWNTIGFRKYRVCACD